MAQEEKTNIKEIQETLKIAYHDFLEDLRCPSFFYKELKDKTEKARAWRISLGFVSDLVRIGILALVSYGTNIGCQEECTRLEPHFESAQNQAEEVYQEVKPFLDGYVIKFEEFWRDAKSDIHSISTPHPLSCTTYTNPTQNNSSSISLRAPETLFQSLDNLI